MDAEALLKGSRPFVEWAVAWHNQLDRMPLDELITDPSHAAIISVDVIQGFCSQGPLASDRVGAIVAPIVRLFWAAHARGVRHFVLTQDHHPADAVEFGSYGPHCMSGTAEAEPVPEFLELPFFDQFVTIHKNSISSSVGTELDAWLDQHAVVDTFVVVGDCTDLCTYQLAMHLRLRANARQQKDVRVVLPADCVDTYDLPVSVAEQIGAVPHDGDLLHLIFLYSMMLNGVQVVARIDG